MYLALHGIVSILCLILWIWALVDCLTNASLQGTDKLIWVIVIVFLPLLGAVLYLVIARKRSV